MSVLAKKNPKQYISKYSRKRLGRNSLSLSKRQRTALVKRVEAFGVSNINVCRDEMKAMEFIKGFSSDGKE